MSRKARLPQTARHILVYDEDWDYIETRFGPTGIKPIGISTAIRDLLIHRGVLAWREAEIEAANRQQREQREEPTDGNTTDIERPSRG